MSASSLEVGTTYGNTLFLGLKPEERKEASDSLLKLLPLLTTPPQSDFFASPLISFKLKEEMLKVNLESRLNPFVFRFLLLLMQKGRWSDLDAIAHNFSKQVLEEENELKVTLKAAAPLTDASKKQLLTRLSDSFHKNISLEIVVDPQLIGGAILKVGHTLWDGSVKGKLERIKERLLTTHLKEPL